eukprot:COSAG02_NODE_134_length_34593_cov_43.594886_17_plen_58_part_00
MLPYLSSKKQMHGSKRGWTVKEGYVLGMREWRHSAGYTIYSSYQCINTIFSNISFDA